jgi:superfamily II DNA helicase RecQ
MNFQLFQYPLPAPPELTDLNSYLGSHRIASVSHHLVETPGGTMLVFLVQTVGPSPKASSRSEARIDYRAVLAPDEFASFSRLRDVRKKIAEEEGLPVYAICTNAQLAELVRQRPKQLAELAAIDGIGKARVEKYGQRLLDALAASTEQLATT